VDSFLAEAALKRPNSLDDYNRLLNVWIQECYHTRQHGGLSNGQTPEAAYKNSKSPLRFLPAETVASAFMRCEQRKVDKSGCISFSGKKYEVGVLFIGQTINVVYDPADIETIIVEHERTGASLQVKELKIGVHTGTRPSLPKSMLKAIPETSRYLDEKEKRYQARYETVRRAISFKDLNAAENKGLNTAERKAGESDV
jgi:hypothetical protein